jgi:hypothetical protein
MPRITDVSHGLTAEVLRTIVRYDAENGKFYWLKSNNQSAVVGGEAGTIEPTSGYVRFTVLGRKYQAHRLVWLYVNGRWPEHQIDHRNMIKSDNRIENLREATYQDNAANKRVFKSNIIGLKGVSRKPDGRFIARIGREGRVLTIGVFDCPAAAHFAYMVRADEYYGEFARGS